MSRAGWFVTKFMRVHTMKDETFLTGTQIYLLMLAYRNIPVKRGNLEDTRYLMQLSLIEEDREVLQGSFSLFAYRLTATGKQMLKKLTSVWVPDPVKQPCNCCCCKCKNHD